MWIEADIKIKNDPDTVNETQCENVQIADCSLISDQTPVTESFDELCKSFYSTSSENISRAVIYLSDLMIDLRVSDEFANQIISAVIRLINK